MAKRVQTGCPNCRRCTNSAAGEGGRKAGRAMAAMMTGGLSEGARMATGNCRACGHKMSLHAQAHVAAVAASPTVGSLIARRLESRRELAQRSADELERRRQEAIEPRPPAMPPAPSGDDLAAQLTRLAELNASGVLTDDEFAAAKARLLG